MNIFAPFLVQGLKNVGSSFTQLDGLANELSSSYTITRTTFAITDKIEGRGSFGVVGYVGQTLIYTEQNEFVPS